MQWYKRRYENSPMAETAILNRFETLFMADGGPPAMLLIAQEHAPTVSTLWLRLPDERLRSAFPELAAADESDLPKKAVLLAGHNAEFEKLFEY
jgi:hypothetical protein